MPLIIKDENINDRVDSFILHLEGELDTYNTPEFIEHFNKKIEGGAKNFVVDLSNVNFISSSGWGALSYALKKCTENSGSLALYNLKGQVKRVYKIMGFIAILRSFDDLDQAVKFVLKGK